MAAPFPPELVNQVASYLHGDKRTLAAASKVSRAWLASFRGRLFENIRVKHKGSKDKGFNRFASFLEASPSIRCLIVRLRMKGRLNITTLHKILSLLPHLSTLSFEGWFEPAEPIDPTLPRFRLDQLSIDVVTEEDECDDEEEEDYTDDSDGTGLRGEADLSKGEDNVCTWGWGISPEELEVAQSKVWSKGREDAQMLLSVLRLFSHTRKLYIDYYWNHRVWILPTSDLEELIPTPGILRAESFCFSHLDSSASMFAFFYRLLQPHALTSIATKLDWYPCVNEFRACVREARGLTSFAFAVGERLMTATPDLALKECKALRSLLLQPEYALGSWASDYTGNGDPNSGPRAIFGWDAIQVILEQCISQIHHLTIAINDRPIPPLLALQSLRFIDWQWLENCILNHYPNLKTLTFSFAIENQGPIGGVTLQAIHTFILENTPKLVARDLVRIEKVNAFFEEVFAWVSCTLLVITKEGGEHEDVNWLVPDWRVTGCGVPILDATLHGRWLGEALFDDSFQFDLAVVNLWA